MSSIGPISGPTRTDPIGHGLIDLDAEIDARAVLIAGGLLAGRTASETVVGSHPGGGEADSGIGIDEWELLLCDEQWHALRDGSDPFADVLKVEHRRREPARLRAQLDRLRQTAASDYWSMAMYWGLDGECVSTVAAIAHRLNEDRGVVEHRIRVVMDGLRDVLGVKRPGSSQLRITHARQ